MSSLAEQLGFDAHERVIVLHVDDVGMCHAANVGAFEAMTTGSATCGSVMSVCSWVSEAAGMAQQHPTIDLGVHAVLNAEWEGYRWRPLSDLSAVSTLVDKDGYFKKTTLEVFAEADAGEVEQEIRAQIQHALSLNIDLTHIDAHMGSILYRPDLLDVYLRLGKEFAIPAFLAQPRDAQLEAMGLAELKPMFEKAVSTMQDMGMPVLDGFEINSLGFERGEGPAHMRQRLEGLRPGISYFVVHCAKAGAELNAIAPDAHAREFERSFFSSDAGSSILKELNIRTIGMRTLRDHFRKAL